MSRIVPMNDKVLVAPIAASEVTPGGIVLPDGAQERPLEGTVIEVGPGRVLESGERAEMSVCVGNVVLYTKYGGNEVVLDGVKHLILDESSLLAVRQ